MQDLLTQAAAARRRARADRRCIRSRSQLRDALAAEIQATGDLYGKSIDFNVPAYALALMQLKNNAERGGAFAEEKEPIHD